MTLHYITYIHTYTVLCINTIYRWPRNQDRTGAGVLFGHTSCYWNLKILTLRTTSYWFSKRKKTKQTNQETNPNLFSSQSTHLPSETLVSHECSELQLVRIHVGRQGEARLQVALHVSRQAFHDDIIQLLLTILLPWQPNTTRGISSMFNKFPSLDLRYQYINMQRPRTLQNLGLSLFSWLQDHKGTTGHKD